MAAGSSDQPEPGFWSIIKEGIQNAWKVLTAKGGFPKGAKLVAAGTLLLLFAFALLAVCVVAALTAAASSSSATSGVTPTSSAS